MPHSSALYIGKMVDDRMDDSIKIETFGCVVNLDSSPYLYIMGNDGIMLDGIPFEQEEQEEQELYGSLSDNELVIVGIKVTDPLTKEKFDVELITDDNYDELTYVIVPLRFYTLRTRGLINEDLFELNMFDMLVNGLVKEYIENLQNEQ